MSETRKCITCGAELADQESYCGNCGTKAPGGTVDKEEVELKYITPNEENPPHWTMTWNFHDYLTQEYKSRFGGRRIFACNLITFSGDFVFLSYLLFTHFVMCLYGKIMCELPIVFGIVNMLFAIVFAAAYILVIISAIKLRGFKKRAPEFLYIGNIIRTIAFPLYALIFSLFASVPTYVNVIGIVEMLYGLLSLIITYMYYSKRAKAFIY